MNVENIARYKKIIVVGTDTEVGKTYVSVKIMEKLKKLGLNTCGLKPISSGGVKIGQKFFNLDALKLISISSTKYDYNVINPNFFRLPVAPHIAAYYQNCHISLVKLIKQTHKSLEKIKSDITIIETCGGILTPLNRKEFFSDYIKALKFPVIMVVKMKLGCINHALLTAMCFREKNINCIGWVANTIGEKMEFYEDNIITLEKILPFPKLHEQDFEKT